MPSITDEILGGAHDALLSEMADAITMRRRIIGKHKVAKLQPGDTVSFSNAISPKYLVGKTATVVKINKSTVVVSCPDDPSYGRFNGSKGVRCPNSLIEGAVA